jgi:hypothetical protein
MTTLPAATASVAEMVGNGWPRPTPGSRPAPDATLAAVDAPLVSLQPPGPQTISIRSRAAADEAEARRADETRAAVPARAQLGRRRRRRD